MRGSYNPTLVALSVFIAVLASYTALQLAGLVSADEGRRRWRWLVGGSCAMGVGIWSMHFIGMLAFHLPVPVAYDLPLLLLSVLVAVAASAVALLVVGQRPPRRATMIGASAAIGVALAGMHYIGMASMRLPARISYLPSLVALSILIAVASGGAALWLAFRLRDEGPRTSWLRPASAVLMGVGMSGMHYTAMAAARFGLFDAELPVGARRLLATDALAVAVILGTGAILLLALLGTAAERWYRAMLRETELLRRSEERYRAFLEHTSEAVWRFELDEPLPVGLPEDEQMARLLGHAHLAECNDAMARMYGYARAEEVIGKRLGELLDPDSPENTEYLRQAVRAGYRISECESIELDRHGRRHHFVNSLVGIVENGALRRIWGTQRDVTERRRVELALRESEERFRLMAEATPVMIWTSQPDGFCDYVNRAWLRFTGQSLPEALGTGWSAAIPPQDRNGVVSAFRRAVERGEPFAAETRLRAVGGEYRHVLVQGVPRVRPDGALAGYIGSAVDIEEFKRAAEIRDRAEARLRDYTAELEARVNERTASLQRANSYLEAFSYSVSHDLKAPLRAIQGFAEVIEEDYSDRLEEPARDYLRRIASAAHRMSSLVEDLLAFSRISRAELTLEEVSPRAAVNEALATLRPEIDESGGEVRVALDDAPLVRAHSATLAQVFTNLIGNALKFVAPGVRPKVRITWEQRGRCALLWVEDNGIGIAPEHQERIFQVFERLHSLERYPGTGVGLAIVAKGMEQMGGRVGVESEPREGSRFWIELPCEGERPPDAAAAEARAAELQPHRG